jgi:hypothetical protein
MKSKTQNSPLPVAGLRVALSAALELLHASDADSLQKLYPLTCDRKSFTMTLQEKIQSGKIAHRDLRLSVKEAVCRVCAHY